MNILLVSAYGLPHIGGVELVVRELAERLAARGHGVVHITSTAGPAAPRRERGPYLVARVRAYNGLETRLGVPYPLFSSQLLGVLRAAMARADVLHAHGFLYQPTLVAFALARTQVRRPALVLTEHVGHVDYESTLLDRAEATAIATLGRFSVRAADATVVLNGRVEDQVRVLDPRGKVCWIANGVDLGRFRPATPPEREALRAELGWDGLPRALFVGRPVAKKGFPLALGALTAAQGRFRLAVAGADALPHGTPPGVDLLGRISPDRMPAVYRACDALLLPSRGEGFPLTVQEAMASGLPVLLSDDPGYKRNLTGAGEAVRLLPPSPDAMARAVSELVEDAKACRAAGRAAREHAASVFSRDRAVEAHEALYRELLDGR